MNNPTRPGRLCLALGAALVVMLAGCAAPRMIDSEVQSFAGTSPAVRGAVYRFERLPSQQANATSQDQLEQLAEQALSNAGLTRATDAAGQSTPRYSVEVDVSVVKYMHVPPRMSHRSDMFWGVGLGEGPLSLSWMLNMEPPWYRHSVHLLLRDIASSQVAYESTASFDGPWSDSANLLPAIFEAALRDYPAPPSGARKVVVELPGSGRP